MMYDDFCFCHIIKKAKPKNSSTIVERKLHRNWDRTMGQRCSFWMWGPKTNQFRPFCATFESAAEYDPTFIRDVHANPFMVFCYFQSKRRKAHLENNGSIVRNEPLESDLMVHLGCFWWDKVKGDLLKGTHPARWVARKLHEDFKTIGACRMAGMGRIPSPSLQVYLHGYRMTKTAERGQARKVFLAAAQFLLETTRICHLGFIMNLWIHWIGKLSDDWI